MNAAGRRKADAMILTGSEDIRIRKTINAIRSVFEEMLLEMPYEKITVKELCNRALINKTTFYRYYPTLEDLLAEVQWEFAEPYIELTAGLRYPDDLEQIVREFMRYSAEQGPLYDAILSSGTYSAIMRKVLDDMSEERAHDYPPPKGWSDDEWAIYIEHVNTAQTRIYKKWVDQGKTVPVERMVELTVRLICDGARL